MMFPSCKVRPLEVFILLFLYSAHSVAYILRTVVQNMTKPSIFCQYLQQGEQSSAYSINDFLKVNLDPSVFTKSKSSSVFGY